MPALQIQPPPRLPEPEDTAGTLISALPMVGSLGSVLLVTSMVGAQSGPQRLVATGLFVVTTVAFVVLQIDRQRARRRRSLLRSRESYLDHVADVRREAQASAERQRVQALIRDPRPEALPALVHLHADRLRTRDQTHFLRVRVGVADGERDEPLLAPSVGVDRESGAVDPVCADGVRRLLEVHGSVPDLPVTVDLRAWRRVEICGPEEAARATARALVCSVVAAHGAQDVAISVVAPLDVRQSWDWVKWLPHLREDAADGSDSDRHRILIVDGAPTPAVDSRIGATVVALPYRWDAHTDPGCLRIEVGTDAAHVLVVGMPARAVALDRCSVEVADALARRVAGSATYVGESVQRQDLLTALGLGQVAELDPRVAWRGRTVREWLRVPIGVTDDGALVHLDLKETAQGGVGPHGLVIGATGSGKSEFLRTLVLGLAATHPPDEVNLVLVDFKGGATFAGLSTLPHVSALITNLADDLALVDRMQDALAGELVRRQEILRAAGNLTSRTEYAAARRVRTDLAPLPALVVVIDEFSELLGARPAFADLFATIGRLGRSLGLHLLLASQRLDEGRLRGLESHLSYRVALRTFSAAESRAVIGVSDAHELPPVPGMGLLQADPETLTRFRGGFVSGPVEDTARCSSPQPIRAFTLASAIASTIASPIAPAPGVPPVSEGSGSRTVLDVAVTRLAGHGMAAHRIWLPPLDVPEPLDHLGSLAVGVVDLPRQQRRERLTLHLGGAGGHVAVVGGPRSGKSCLLATVMTAVAMESSPQDTQFYVLDLTGGLSVVADLPHVAGRASRSEADLVARIVSEVGALVAARETTQRRDDGHGEVYLVVDGWAVLRAESDDLETAVQDLAARGLAVGVHVIASAGRWSDFRASMRDLLGTRLELRLGDPSDSEVDRRLATEVPPDRPGRGLTTDRHHFLAAEPVDADTVAAIRSRWVDRPGPRLRVLPDALRLDDLRHSDGMRIGVAEPDLATAVLDPTSSPHLVVFGDAGSGKTTLLRTLASEIVRTHAPERAQVVVVDYRRTLRGRVPESHLFDHLTSPVQAGPVLSQVAEHLARRLDGDPRGAALFVLVDDYDLVAGPSGSPLAPLVPLLAQAGEVGLRLVVARRVGGAARASYDPVLQTLRDLAMPGLLLSGSPDEGPLLGNLRPALLPPGRGRLVTRERGVQLVQVARVE